MILQAITAGREECDLKPLKHLLTLAEAFYRQGLDTVLCLRAERQAMGSATSGSSKVSRYPRATAKTYKNASEDGRQRGPLALSV